MSIRDFFRSGETTTPEQVRDFLDKHMPDGYNLVDVRQPGEYQQGHLPGARLIRPAELASRTNELDAAVPTIAY